VGLLVSIQPSQTFLYAARRALIVGGMHGTFLQRVLLTLFLAFCTAGLIEFYKNVIQKGDAEINGAWRAKPDGAAHP
jgi:hypothetical protein